MSDDSARHRIGGNNPPETIDDDSARPLADIQSPILSIPAAQKYLGGVGLTTIYDKMARGELEVCKLGGRRFVTRRSCDAYIERSCSHAVTDKMAIARARKAGRESVRKRRERAAKKKLVRKSRGRSERRAAATVI
jgi:hypothetical protein